MGMGMEGMRGVFSVLRIVIGGGRSSAICWGQQGEYGALVLVKVVAAWPSIFDRRAVLSTATDCSLESRRLLRLRRELSGLRRRGSLIILTLTVGGVALSLASGCHGVCFCLSFST